MEIRHCIKQVRKTFKLMVERCLVRAGALEATVELLKFNAKTNIATGVCMLIILPLVSMFVEW